jgi:dipicolinate synthase subunit B
MDSIQGKKIGFAITASFCTFDTILEPIENIINAGAAVTPILSFNAATVDTRYMKAEDFKSRLVKLTGNDIIASLVEAEPVGPKALFDIVIVAPCTGNTLAKLACGITDTPVTMACKAQRRNDRPVLLAISTNDALSLNATNIAKLMSAKGYYFVPYKQDNAQKKPTSIIADMNLILPAALEALDGKQLQPVLV